MNIVVILSSSGGILAFISAIIFLGRGIFKQVNATEDNTEAVKQLTTEVTALKNGFNGHEVRITVLEDRDRRKGNAASPR